ncbi:MAG TPA: energy transducer TonB [Bryobacteraceae bacterium]|nr:energy transducer TonB [Bryobacteraceae bacterium]
MRARLLSLMIHLGVIALLIVVSSRSTLINHSGAHPFDRSVRLVLPSPYRGGGGGGERSALPASRGRLPRLALRQFTPPSATPPTTQRPLLVIEPTLIAPADVHLPDVMLAQLGDPFGRLGPPSSGPGSGGGIGDGVGGGVGNKRGPGFGPDDGGGIGGLAAGGSLIAPSVLYKVEPEFSDEARKAKYQGTVLLTIEVGEDGQPHQLRVLRGLGLGLDEKAIEAVSRWKFKPALRNGRPVRAAATIEVNFRLL